MWGNGTLYSTLLLELSPINEVLPTPDRECKDDREARIRNLLWKVRDAQGHELWPGYGWSGGGWWRPRATGTAGRQAVCLAFLEASWKYPPMTAPASRLTSRMLPRLGSAMTVVAFESQKAV